MAWTATVTNKEILDGEYFVTIDFTDGQHSVTRTFKNRYPTQNWIPDTVRDAIARLESAYEFDIAVGAVTPSDPVPADLTATFRQRCRILEIADLLIRRGVISDTNPKYIALVNWITNNFNTYFDQL